MLTPPSRSRSVGFHQLFNTFDPSPFHERDLDDDAEAYIVDSVDEFPLQKHLRLIIHLPAEQISGNTDLPQAVHNYFAYRFARCNKRLIRLNASI